MEWGIYIALVLIGACLGSFAGATVWRLRARQLRDDKKDGEKVDAKELNRLKGLLKSKITSDRSRCLECGYTLRWYDLIPIFSWLSLRGKCRHCHKPIGKFELLIELGMVAFFVLSYALWPFELVTGWEIARLVLWLIAGVALAILFAYDLKWFLLPDKVSFTVIGLGALTVAVASIVSGDVLNTVLSAAAAAGILSGLYLLLYLASKGAWVGFGDIKLGLGLALLLVDWKLALVALFLANLIGCLIVIPLLATKRLERKSHVPFGPLLIAGTVIAFFIGSDVIDWYVFGLI